MTKIKLLPEKLRECFNFDESKMNVSYDMIRFVNKFKVNSDALMLFKADLTLRERFLVEKKCVNCDETSVCNMDYAEFLRFCEKIENLDKDDWISDIKATGWMCSSCCKKEDAEMDVKILAQNLESKIGQFLRTDAYINPDDVLESLKGLTPYYERKLSSRLKSIKYHEFLKTHYWLAVSRRVKDAYGGLCLHCHTHGGNLEAHHKTYDRHGMEHIYWESDLVPLCRKCHQLEHDKKGTSFKNK